MVFQRSMLYWGSVCLRYLYIMLYVKLIWCCGLPDNYGQLEGMESVCSRVAVFHRSMVDWRRGWGLFSLVSMHSAICVTSLV